MHRTTAWRRARARGKEYACGKPLPGRAWAEIEASKSAQYLSFACAVVGQLVENGEANLFDVKVMRDGRSVWHDCPAAQKEKLLGCDRFKPATIALAAAEIACLTQETVIGARSILRRENRQKEIIRASVATASDPQKLLRQKEIVLTDLIRRQSPGLPANAVRAQIAEYLDDPEQAVEDMGESVVTRSFAGSVVRRESYVSPLPLHKIRDLGYMSRRMVCHWRTRPDFPECKEWLLLVVGRKITGKPARGVVIRQRDDVSNALSHDSEEQWRRRTVRLASPEVAARAVPLDTETAWVGSVQNNDHESVEQWDNGSVFYDDIDARLGWSE